MRLFGSRPQLSPIDEAPEEVSPERPAIVGVEAGDVSRGIVKGSVVVSDSDPGAAAIGVRAGRVTGGQVEGHVSANTAQSGPLVGVSIDQIG